MLDVAAGRGRHALFLAARGWHVHAVDRDRSVIDAIVADAPAGADLTCEVLDLETGTPHLGRRCYDAVIVFHYLHRPLMPAVVDAVAEHGVLVYRRLRSIRPRADTRRILRSCCSTTSWLRWSRRSRSCAAARASSMVDVSRRSLRAGEALTPRDSIACRCCVRSRCGGYFCCLCPTSFMLKRGRQPPPANLLSDVAPLFSVGSTELMITAGPAFGAEIFHSSGGYRYVLSSFSWGRVLTGPVGPGFLRGRFEWAVEAAPVIAQYAPYDTFGAGVSPLTWRWNFDPRGKLAPYVELAGGLLWTTEPGARPDHDRQLHRARVLWGALLFSGSYGLRCQLHLSPRLERQSSRSQPGHQRARGAGGLLVRPPSLISARRIRGGRTQRA